jgi:arsenate reductase
MKEIGVDISRHRAKHVDEFAGQQFDYVLTVCDNANESCPVWPGKAQRLHRAFEDPAALHAPEQERVALFRRVRDEIRDYLGAFPPEC